VVEIILERITNVAMGTEIDNVTEFEDTIDLPTEFALTSDYAEWSEDYAE
jgi:tartronate-semialdehyde synthase